MKEKRPLYKGTQRRLKGKVSKLTPSDGTDVGQVRAHIDTKNGPGKKDNANKACAGLRLI